MINEISLLNKLKQKRQTALQTAIELYTPYISVVLFRKVGASLPREDIEEIVSDVFIALWQNANHIDPKKGSIKNYITGIAKRLAARKLQKQSGGYIQLDELEIQGEDNVSETCIENDKAMFLWNAVMGLGEPDNEIFVRYYWYGEKIREIAAVMELNQSTVKTKLSRGKKKLKERLSDMEERL
ncbi:MAG: sigma-70 family RNA polymerase sigma factor [Clostridia bacterium]|nr:sigma-70 family RNA polymerase sigma factor [Clostridia bacterium]